MTPPTDALVGNRRYRLLVTDDEELNRDMLSRRLERRGYSVLSARSGPETLAMLLDAPQLPVDLVLLDIMMPEMDGYEVLRRLRERYSAAELPVIMATARRESADVVNALGQAANDYVTKPIDFPILLARIGIQLDLLEARRALDRQIAEAHRLSAELETRNQFIQTVFGRYVAKSVVGDLLEKPDALQLGGVKRDVSLLMSDLRGFTALSERLDPQEVVALLNIYLGEMFAIISAHHGTINDLSGDGIFVLFGAPLPAPDHAAQAAACALAMQRGMSRVNELAAAAGLPAVEMGIGLNSGEVTVGNVGSEHHAKYGAIGRNVNLTARIEACTVGGQILAGEATIAALGARLVTGQQLRRDVKGAATPLLLHEVMGLRDRGDLDLPRLETIFTPIRSPIPVYFARVEDKSIGLTTHSGELVGLSPTCARIATPERLDLLANIKLAFPYPPFLPWEAYAKVIGHEPAPSPNASDRYTVRFTDLPPELAAVFREQEAA